MILWIFFLIFNFSPLESTSRASAADKNCENIKLPPSISWIGFSQCKNGPKDVKSNKIIGGVDAGKGEFPYAVMLLTPKTLTFFCAGTLIHPRWIMTARHCTKYNPNFVVALNTDNSIRPKSDLIFNPEKVFEYGKKFDPLINNDISLIKLNQSIDNELVHVAKIISPAHHLKKDTELTMIGWGFTIRMLKSPKLQKATAYLHNNRECAAMFNLIKIEKGHLCSKGPLGNLCLGDSGSPLIVKGNKPENDIVIGIASFTKSFWCHSHRNPNVFVNVQHYYKWIRKILALFDDKISDE